MTHEGSKAVFLSYASQDAEAARRIAESLRAAGIEVWFDQSELTGGDAWDKKIRDQIQSCALFLPIISANTQARTEGYFRLEWRLAEQRTHLMAKGRPFLMPIVIDDTRDNGAHVPDAFLDMQWSRFPDGRCDEKFAAHVSKLLAWDGHPTSAPARRLSSPSPASEDRPKSLRWIWFALPGVLTGLAFAFWPLLKPTSPPAASTVQAVSETDSLVARAWALLEEDPLMTRRNVELAEQLALQAVAADPTNAEANAAAAWANFRYLIENYESTPERRADLRRFAETAALLDPESVNAELAVCGMLLVTGRGAEARERIAALAERAPDHSTVLRVWAVSELRRTWGEAETGMPAAVARLRDFSPAGYSYVHSMLAVRAWGGGYYADAERNLDLVFATGVATRESYLIRLLLLTYGWGELEEAREFIGKIPDKLLLEDVFISHVATVWLRLGNYDSALETLDRTQREILQEALVQLPIGLYRGKILALAGRSQAAAIALRSALEVVEAVLADQPSDLSTHLNKLELLQRLGRADEAAAQYALVLDLMGPPENYAPWMRNALASYHIRAGDYPAAIPLIDASMSRDNPRWANLYNNLRQDPENADFSRDPGMQPIMNRAAAWMAELRAEAGRGDDTPSSAEASAKVEAQSVAVLAFENMSGDVANEYFSDGISEELLNVLAKIPGLKVTARTSAFFFKDKQVAIAEIAQQLGVAYVVEGSVRKSGDRVRISAQLIKASDGFQVWSENFDRDLKDIFAVQDEIAGLVAQQLQLKLGVTNPARAVDPEAYRLLLEARFFWNQRGLNNFDRAADRLQRALAIDPDFAPAHALMADVWVLRADWSLFEGAEDVSVELAELRKSVNRALELDPSMVEPYYSMAKGLAIERKVEEAGEWFEKAFALSPPNATKPHWYGEYLIMKGEFLAGLEQLEKTSAGDPMSFIVAYACSIEAYNMENWEETLRFAERADTLRSASFVGTRALEAFALLKLGRTAEAIELARTIRRSWPGPMRVGADATAVAVLRAAGLEEEATEYAELLLAEWPPHYYMRGFVLADMGRFDEAVPYLERLPADFLQYLAGPLFQAYRDDPRFTQLLETLNWTEAYKKARADIALVDARAAR